MCGPMGSCDPRNKTMTIDEAIEILTQLHDSDTSGLNYLGKGAVKLGIEALRATQLLQKQWPHLTQLKLPGETKD